MKRCLPLILLAAPLCAQTPRLALPVGAHVKIDSESGGPSIEGTVVAWRRDTVLVQPQGRSDTVHVAPAAVKKLRILESPPLWRYTSPGDINFSFSASLPRPTDRTSASGDAYDRLLLVGTKTELAGVSPVTGAVQWTRKDLADLKVAALDIAWSTGFAIITQRDTMEIIDVRTGLKRWDSGSQSFLAVRGWLPSPAADTAILILGRTAGSATTLMLIDLLTGRVRWRQDSAFTVEPKVFESGGVPYLIGHQSPFADSDTTFVLYISTDGPIRIDSRSGRVLWRGTLLRGAKLPLPTDGYGAIARQQDLLFVPSGDSLIALRASDGTAAWPTGAHKFKNRVFRIMRTPRGLLVRGYEWFDLLDPVTGRSLWRAPVELKNATWDVRRGDTDYVAGDKRVVAIGITDGTVRTIAPVDFKEREQPTGFTVWKQGLILNSWHNLMLVDRQGTVRYQREYPSPKLSFGERLKNTAAGSDIMRPTTRWVGSHIFFYTGAADEAGREGFSVVEVDPVDGREAGRLWFNERVPSYRLDDVSSIAYYRRDDHTLDAFPFLDGEDLSYAVRNGQRGVVAQLLAMGEDPAAPGTDGWTLLHSAALNGHGDVARLLIDHGAKVAAKTREGWTPWMLAVRERHDSLAQILGTAADSSSAGAAAANGWRLSRQGRIAEAVAELNRGAALDSTLALWPSVWQSVCWNGAVAHEVGAVMSVCDRAVERTPPDDANYGSAHLSRAIARALAGNFEGAASDLDADRSSVDDDSSIGRWIATLRQGRNPFSPTVLAQLQR